MTEKVLAWHGDPALKAEVMERLRAHREADEFMQGIYQRIAPKTASGYRGCAIGCTLPPRPATNYSDYYGAYVDAPDDWHVEVQRLYGIDCWVGSAIDDLFEALPPNHCAAFAVDVVDAIPVGADLSDVVVWAERLGELIDHRAATARPALAAEFIALLRNAPVPTPA